MARLLKILCIVDRRRNAVARKLRQAGHTVVETFTSEEAVAICVNNKFDLVMVDQHLLREVDDWSVAQSIKMVSGISVVVVSQTIRRRLAQLTGVDATLSARDLQQPFGHPSAVGHPKVISPISNPAPLARKYQ